jgi:hypothetical protein
MMSRVGNEQGVICLVPLELRNKLGITHAEIFR